MARMPRRVETQQSPTGKIDAQFMRRRNDARRVDRQNLSVEALDLGCAVHRGDPFDQPGRSDHMRDTARMDQQPGVRESAHHAAGAAGVVEVDVRQHDVIDALGAQTKLRQGSQRRRQ